MPAYTNANLTLRVDPSNSLFVGRTQVGTNPMSVDASGGIGKSGDYFYGEPSLFWKIGAQWWAISSSEGMCDIAPVPNW